MLFLATVAVPVGAEPFPVLVRGDSLALQVTPQVGSDVLPLFVRDRLERGIPATIALQIDLWRSRGGWFDDRVAQVIQRYRVSRDPWSGTFLAEGPGGPFTADSLAAVVDHLGSQPIPVPLTRNDARGAEHWIEATAVTVPLSVQDLGEVEEWISGEIGGGGSGPVLGIPSGLFRIVRDLTGLGDRKLAGRSGRFEISLIAGDFVWVRPSRP